MATHYTQDPYYGKTIKMIDDDIHLFCSQPNCCSISATCNTTHLRDFILARGGIVEGVPLWDAWGVTKPSRVHRWFARYVTMNLLNDSLAGVHNVADAATFEEIKDRVFTQFWPFIINANRYLRFLDGTIEDPPSPLISSRLHSTDSISAYTLSSSP